MKKSVAVFAAIMGGVLAFAACGGKEGSLTKKQCAKVFGEVASVLLEEPSKPVNTVAPLAYREAEDYGNVNGTGAFVYFVGEVLKNDKFQVYDAPSRFTCSYEEDFYDLKMLVSYHPSEGRVGGEIWGKNTRSVNPDRVECFYLAVDVNYDFEKDKIVSFELGMVDWSEGTERGYLANKYQSGVLYELDTYEKDSEYDMCAQSLDALEKAFSAKTAKDLKADFSEEYARSMQLVEDD